MFPGVSRTRKGLRLHKGDLAGVPQHTGRCGWRTRTRIATVHCVRSVIITGISRGLGAALFDEFRGAGDRILALGRRFTDAQHAAERQDPQRVRLRQVDLAYPTTLPPAAELSSF